MAETEDFSCFHCNKAVFDFRKVAGLLKSFEETLSRMVETVCEVVETGLELRSKERKLLQKGRARNKLKLYKKKNSKNSKKQLSMNVKKLGDSVVNTSYKNRKKEAKKSERRKVKKSVAILVKIPAMDQLVATIENDPQKNAILPQIDLFSTEVGVPIPKPRLKDQISQAENKCLGRKSELIKRKPVPKPRQKAKIVVHSDVVLSNLDSLINEQILAYNASSEKTDQYISSKQRSSCIIKAVGLTENLPMNVVEDYLWRQNPCFQHDSLVKVLQIFANANNVSWSVELEVDPKSYRRILKKKFLKIKWDSCEILDAVAVRRCYNCSGFNHSAGICKNRIACPKCAGPHTLKSCNSGTVHSCVNCIRTNKRFNLKLDVQHAAWSQGCEVYKRKIDTKFMLYNLNSVK